jgi:CBS domain-containing protein
VKKDSVSNEEKPMTEQYAYAEIVRNSNPLVLPVSTMVMEAARLMDSQRVSAVLVTEGKAKPKLVGIFTARDAVSRVLAPGRDPTVTDLGEVMTYDPVVMTVGGNTSQALCLMEGARCRHLPIVDDDGKVVGVISRGEFRAAD